MTIKRKIHVLFFITESQN